MTFRGLWHLMRTALGDFSADRASTRGAAIAYYTTFSLAPLLLLVVAVAGLVFGEEAARGALVGQIGGLIGEDGARTLQDLMQSAGDTGQGIVSTVVSVVLLAVAATTVLAELQDALNVIWKAEPSRASGLWAWLRTRLLSLSLIGAVGFLLLVSLVADAALTAFGTYVLGSDTSLLLRLLTFAVSYLILTTLFAAIYKILPERRLAWRDVWIGAAVTALLFTIGKFAIGLYIGTSDMLSAYGGAGTLVLVLVWVFYSSQIFLLGAEFTKAYAFAHGSRKDAAAPSGMQSERGRDIDPGRTGR